MKKLFSSSLLVPLIFLSGCSIENPDKEEFEVQYKGPEVDEEIGELFKENENNNSL